VDSGSIHAIELVFLLLLFVVVFRSLAQRLRLPYSIISVIAGTLLGFVPGTPRIKRDRDMAFFAVLRVTIHQIGESCLNVVLFFQLLKVGTCFAFHFSVELACGICQ
jgi:NhaP-type Na+/H+ or K+/H+ antiporter